MKKIIGATVLTMLMVLVFTQAAVAKIENRADNQNKGENTATAEFDTQESYAGLATGVCPHTIWGDGQCPSICPICGGLLPHWHIYIDPGIE